MPPLDPPSMSQALEPLSLPHGASYPCYPFDYKTVTPHPMYHVLWASAGGSDRRGCSSRDG
eukprot:scaffold60484_cov27-Phaeocystis_antarctica.AAC.1